MADLDETRWSEEPLLLQDQDRLLQQKNKRPSRRDYTVESISLKRAEREKIGANRGSKLRKPSITTARTSCQCNERNALLLSELLFWRRDSGGEWVGGVGLWN